MSDLNTREVVERYCRGMVANDIDEVMATLHPDYTDEYPQSGERVRGPDALRDIMNHYPGGRPRTAAIEQLIGTEDQWVVSPSSMPMRIDGSGDQYTTVTRVVYPDGSMWHAVQLIRLRDGKIYRVVSYFAAPFEAPAWRAPYVDRFETDPT